MARNEGKTHRQNRKWEKGIGKCLTMACHGGILSSRKEVGTMNKPNRERDTLISVRTTPEVKAGLKELTALLGEELGAKISQTQALEMLINEALRARTVGADD